MRGHSVVAPTRALALAAPRPRTHGSAVALGLLVAAVTSNTAIRARLDWLSRRWGWGQRRGQRGRWRRRRRRRRDE